MATLQALVQGYIGSTGAGADTVNLGQWLTECAQLLITRLPIEILKPYGSNLTVGSGGVAVNGYRIIEVHAANYSSILYPAGMKARLADSNSLYYATATSPGHCIDGGKLYVLPSGGVALAVQLPTVAATDSSI